MVKDILSGAGFVENVTFKECRFLKAPQETYAVYFDDVSASGADDKILIMHHAYTVEMYSVKPDSEKEKAIEGQLTQMGIEYTKQARFFIESVQLYQVIYEFDYTEK